LQGGTDIRDSTSERERPLSGRRVLVTGADRGIGLAIALSVAAAGAAVAVHYPPVGPGADETVAMLDRAGYAAVPVEGDLADPNACHAVVDEAAERLGGLDALVNNAGVTRTAPFADVDPEFLSTLLAINFGGQFFCAQRAVTYFTEAAGCIVNLSSWHATHGYKDSTVYAAAKGAVEAWTRSLAIELAPSVRVNAVAPGMVETARVVQEFPNYSRERMGARNPMGRVGFPGDVADVVIFLLSDASRYMTGEVLHVDGGSSAR
jgi:NAD(P)-dependent dehydrogenase (short-subunit alcohol dehydrogenase family)